MVLIAPKPLDWRYPKELKTIGDHIRKRRLDLGLLQKEVAEILDTDKTSISNWETYGKKPDIKKYKAIIDFLGYVPFEEGPSIGEKIWYYRAVRGMTHRELADQLGLDEGTVNDWENNKSGKMLKKIEEAFKPILTAYRLI